MYFILYKNMDFIFLYKILNFKYYSLIFFTKILKYIKKSKDNPLCNGGSTHRLKIFFFKISFKENCNNKKIKIANWFIYFYFSPPNCKLV